MNTIEELREERDAALKEIERLRRHLRAISTAEDYIRGDWFELADWMSRHAKYALRPERH